MRLAVRAAGGILFAARHGYHFHPVELPDQPPPGTITLLLERSRKGEAAARDDLYRHIDCSPRATGTISTRWNFRTNLRRGRSPCSWSARARAKRPPATTSIDTSSGISGPWPGGSWREHPRIR